MNRSGNTGKYSSSSLETEKAGFLFHRKVRPMKQKTLREDRTAAEWNYVADATAAGGESRKRDSFLFYRRTTLQ